MLSIDLDIGIHVVGEPIEQGYKLFARKRAKLYMIVPKSWPIPDGYVERLMPEGTLGITDENVLSLNGEYRLRREGIISEDWQKASRQIDWFYHRVQQAFWDEVFEKGVVVAIDKGRNNYPPGVISLIAPGTTIYVDFLIPKSLPHKMPTKAKQRDAFRGIFWQEDIVYYPAEPKCKEDYDVYAYGDIDMGVVYNGNNDTRFNLLSFFHNFEAVRAAIQEILDV